MAAYLKISLIDFCIVVRKCPTFPRLDMYISASDLKSQYKHMHTNTYSKVAAALTKH